MKRRGEEAPVRWFFYIYVNGERLASGDCPTEADRNREAWHYASQYLSEGPVKVVLRRSRRRPASSKAKGGKRRG